MFTIALDARTVHRIVRRGTGKNLVDLYQHVLALRPDWHVVGFHRETGHNPPWPAHLYRARRLEMPGDRFLAWDRWALSAAARWCRADLLHCPANLCPTRHAMPVLLTVHDLLPLEAGGLLARTFELGLRHAARRDLVVITPSRYIATQLHQRFDISPERIVVNPWAPDSAMARLAMGDSGGAARSAAQFNPQLAVGIDKPYVLHLGATHERKNTARVIDAWAAVPAHVRKEHTLLIVGLDDAAARKRFESRVTERHVVDSVKLAGFVPDDELAQLLAGAQLLLYPSLAEGFGLPILDAWAARTAVITSRLSSLPEVGGDAVSYVDPTDVDQIGAEVARLLADQSARDALIDRGSERVTQYTWDATARRFIDAVELAVGRNRSLAHAA